MDSGGGSWGLLTIIGPILIVIALAYAVMRNRKARNPADIERTERATRELYREEEASRGDDGNNAP